MMEREEQAALEDEGRTFGTAILGVVPDDYVASQYARAHQHLALQPATAFDDTLLAFAALGPLSLRAADGYARFFAPTTALRRKLAVLVAILESTAPSDTAFAAQAEPASAVVVRLVFTGVGFALLLAVGIVALAPLQLASRWQEDDA